MTYLRIYDPHTPREPQPRPPEPDLPPGNSAAVTLALAAVVGVTVAVFLLGSKP